MLPEFAMIAGAMRQAGFQLIDAHLSGDRTELIVTVTGANFTVDGLDKSIRRSACARFVPQGRAVPTDQAIPWPELNHSEKFQVIADLLATLRR